MENNLSKLATALSKAQGVMSGAKKDKKNPFFKSSYADLASVFEAIREPFAENGLSVSQGMRVLDSGRTIICTKLMHSSGEFIDSEMLLPDIADPQKIGSAITYYRRYSLMAIAGIPAEDDDGNAAAKAVAEGAPIHESITDDQIKDLEIMINGHDDIRQMIVSKLGDLKHLRKDRYQATISWIAKLIVQKKESQNS